MNKINTAKSRKKNTIMGLIHLFVLNALTIIVHIKQHNYNLVTIEII